MYTPHIETHCLGKNLYLQHESWNPNAKFNYEIPALNWWPVTQTVNLHPKEEDLQIIQHLYSLPTLIILEQLCSK